MRAGGEEAPGEGWEEEDPSEGWVKESPGKGCGEEAPVEGWGVGRRPLVRAGGEEVPG